MNGTIYSSTDKYVLNLTVKENFSRNWSIKGCTSKDLLYYVPFLYSKLLLLLKRNTEIISSNLLIHIEDAMKSTRVLELQYILRFDSFMTPINNIISIATLISSLLIFFTVRLLLLIFLHLWYYRVCSKIDLINSLFTNVCKNQLDLNDD